MFALIVLLALVAALVGAYLVDRRDRKTGHKIGSAADYRTRLRASKKARRSSAFGRGPINRMTGTDRLPYEPRDRRRGRRR